jgi:NMD protein affecting ribosome stability and mRNA decay
MKQRDTKRHIPRQDRRIRERVHDPYKTRLKLPEPTLCPDCGALYADGRWQWPGETPSDDVHRERCQACHRIHDKYPAGEVALTGSFLAAHEEEILNLVRHQEEQEKAEHPLHRIMDIEKRNGGLVITTTDIHLPRRIGEALQHAYEGVLDFHYEEEAYSLRVRWSRDGGG